VTVTYAAVSGRISAIIARNQTSFFPPALFVSAFGSVNILSGAHCVLRREWLI
jgi:hypothetical protein